MATKLRGVPAPPIRVVLVDDHDMVAEAIELAFESVDDIEIVSRARSAEEAVAQAGHHRPDVVVLDRRLPDGDGIDVIARIRSVAPESRVMILTGEANAAVAARSVAAGGVGLIEKSARLSDLTGAVRRVAAGEVVVGTKLLSGVFDRLSGRSAAPALTPREHEILRLLADGAGVEQITERLHLARNTVRNHVQRALAKLGAHSRLEAVAIARRLDLLD